MCTSCVKCTCLPLTPHLHPVRPRSPPSSHPRATSGSALRMFLSPSTLLLLLLPLPLPRALLCTRAWVLFREAMSLCVTMKPWPHGIRFTVSSPARCDLPRGTCMSQPVSQVQLQGTARAMVRTTPLQRQGPTRPHRRSPALHRAVSGACQPRLDGGPHAAPAGSRQRNQQCKPGASSKGVSTSGASSSGACMSGASSRGASKGHCSHGGGGGGTGGASVILSANTA